MLMYYVPPKDCLVCNTAKRKSNFKVVVMDESSKVKNVNNGRFFKNEFDVMQLEDVKVKSYYLENDLAYVLFETMKQLAEKQFLNNMEMEAMIKINRELSKGHFLLKQPIEQPKTVVTLSYGEDMFEVADKVSEVNKTKGQFLQLPYETMDGILYDMKEEDGKKVKFAKASTALGIFLYFYRHMLNSAIDGSTSPKYDYSCSVEKDDILKELGIDKRTFNVSEELLINNGWVCRKYNNEYGGQTNAYWYILFKADVEFCKAYTDDRPKRPNAFGGKYGSNAKRTNPKQSKKLQQS